VPEIVTLGICSKKPLHSSDQRRFWRFHDDVKMISHRAIRMNLPFCLLKHPPQRFKKSFSVVVIREDRLSAIPSAHHVIDRSLVFDAQLPQDPLPSSDTSPDSQCEPTGPLPFVGEGIDDSAAFAINEQFVACTCRHLSE